MCTLFLPLPPSKPLRLRLRHRCIYPLSAGDLAGLFTQACRSLSPTTLLGMLFPLQASPPLTLLQGRPRGMLPPSRTCPLCPSACSSSSSQAKASPEVHTHEHAAANSIALPKSPPYSDGQLVQFGSFAPPAGFTMSSNPLPAGSTTAPSSSSHSATIGSKPHERSSRQVLSKRPVFALGPKLSKRFRAEGL